MAFDYNDGGNFRSDLFVNGVKQTVTSWDRTGGATKTTEPDYENDIYGITNGMYLCCDCLVPNYYVVDNTVNTVT